MTRTKNKTRNHMMLNLTLRMLILTIYKSLEIQKALLNGITDNGINRFMESNLS